MTPFLLNYICEPITKAPLKLMNAVTNKDGNILSGELISAKGKRYPIVNGIPRFIEMVSIKSVESFGDEWNYFNFIDFKSNWLSHTVLNTFGTTDIFKGKLIVDAGGGSGSQTKWFLEYGASHVILMDLSHSVDDVVQRNLAGLKNVDIIQCSIDSPPLRNESIDGIIYCHNVIQHTPSVEKTARALYQLTAKNGEFVFNCYPLNDQGFFRWIRFHIIYEPLRYVLSRMPFGIILGYARIMSAFRLIPLLGILFEKMYLCVQGDLPYNVEENIMQKIKRRFKNTCLNTFDAFGSHQFQHHKSDDEIRSLIRELQPDDSKILNLEKYFHRPAPVGCALRIIR